MKKNKYLQIEVVQNEDPVQFKEEFNKKQMELSSLRPETIFDISTSLYKAVIQYEVVNEIPETATEEMSLQGLHFTCENCPRFEPALNNDGSIRQTAKKGKCFLKESTSRDVPVCEWFCKQFLRGELEINKGGLK